MTGIDALIVKEMDGSCTFEVKITPRSSRNALVGVSEGVLKVRIAAPPVDGEANEEIRVFLGKILGRPKSALSILRGESSRRKILKIEGLSAVDLRQRLKLTK